jgi:SAM-dependent methyltransferase
MKHRGWLQTAKIAGSYACDLLFDLRYGTDTHRPVAVEALDTDSENKPHAVHYQPTKARPFLRLLGRLSLPVESGFVDFGSGKGRALLLASQYGFRRVVGVEFSHRLCEIARMNAVRFAKHSPTKNSIEVIEADVASFTVAPDLNIFYLYNPFAAPVLAKVLANIGHSLTLDPRKICLIYNTANNGKMVVDSGLFSNWSNYEIGGSAFTVYTN